ncbi:hypothetical protein MMC07_005706 [Pseudocyphellaria aurata]|nr:hypothetical protein [Pseudocyphellaria aurata]
MHALSQSLTVPEKLVYTADVVAVNVAGVGNTINASSLAAAFAKTGIWPVNRHALDDILLDLQIDPEIQAQGPDTRLNDPQKHQNLLHDLTTVRCPNLNRAPKAMQEQKDAKAADEAAKQQKQQQRHQAAAEKGSSKKLRKQQRQKGKLGRLRKNRLLLKRGAQSTK